MAGQVIDLGKLRFQMRGEWSADMEMESNDVVRYGGNLYVYTYPLKQTGNLPTNTARFALMMPGTVIRGTYDASAPYRIGEAVTFGGSLCRAVEDVAPGVSPEQAPELWLVISSTPSYRGDWAPTTEYRPGDLVTLSGDTITCTVGHVSAATYAVDQAKWTTFLSGMRFRGIYTPGATYERDDLVSNGLHILQANTRLTAPAELVADDWTIVVRGADYLPAQLGNGGKFLTTDGANPQWAAVDTSLQTNTQLLAEIQAAIQAM